MAGKPNEEKWHPDGSPAADGGPALPGAEASAQQQAGASEPEPEQAEQVAAEPQEDPAELKRQLEAAREEARTYLERWARVQADYENYRRRAQREREETVQYANLNLWRELLPVLDNLERALVAASGEGATLESLRAGVELTVRQFRTVLEKAGVVQVEASRGVPFDPHVHEAVLQEEGDSEVPTVVEELQKGYLLGERLVRPALVRVARRSRG